MKYWFLSIAILFFSLLASCESINNKPETTDPGVTYTKRDTPEIKKPEPTPDELLMKAIHQGKFSTLTNLIEKHSTSLLSNATVPENTFFEMLRYPELIAYCTTKGLSIQETNLIGLIAYRMQYDSPTLTSNQIVSFRYINSRILKRQYTPIICIYMAKPDQPDSVGGVGFFLKFVNLGLKTIKYITFTVIPYNRVGDRARGKIKGDNVVFRGQAVGPFHPGGNNGNAYYWGTAWYNSAIASIRIKEVEIEYMDKSKITLNEKQIKLSMDTRKY